MTELTQSAEIQKFLDKIAGLDQAGGNPRLKQISRKLIEAIFETMDEFDVSDDEFWFALNYMAAAAPEYGLWAAGVGIEAMLDIRNDIKDREAGIENITPRTIEGPLYVPGAPLEKGFARLDDGSDEGELLIMHGQVRDADGKPLAGAIVDVWHANTMGNYSYFDQTQSDYNLRRRIETDAEGRYKFRSILPSGYGCPPGSNIETYLAALGRHGKRPAHIHFFVSANGQRHLTTQINIDGDPYLHDDFAYATKDDLIPEVTHHEDATKSGVEGVSGPYAEIEFDFTMVKAADHDEEHESSRARVEALS